MKTVVLGGYGNFGTRISRALAGSPNIELVIAGRDLEQANALAASLGVDSVAIDATSRDLGDVLRRVGAQLVIHTAGPFQGQNYDVAAAALAAGSHYIDLADGRRFVCDFAAALDSAFRKAGLCAVTGASTVPALSSAVVDAVVGRWETIDAIECCIAPAQRAARGVATLGGVLSYCGEPVRVRREGRWREEAGWMDLQRVEFARLRPRLGALCDIPDLELFAARYPQVRTVMFRAALEVGATQRAIAVLAWMRRRGLLRHPSRLAPLLHRAGVFFDRFGTPDGAMVIRIQGTTASGGPLALAWHITAPNHHGPEIPCMAAILLARKLANADLLPVGARACMSLVQLDEFQVEFAKWGMTTEWIEEPSP